MFQIIYDIRWQFEHEHEFKTSLTKSDTKTKRKNKTQTLKTIVKKKNAVETPIEYDAFVVTKKKMR